jgi:peptidoglycan-associated lipoprotein
MEGRDVSVEDIKALQPKQLRDIRFDFDRFDLTPEARAILADNAAWLESNPGTAVMIEGHCDDRGSTEYNVALGDRRAKSAMDYLVNLGVSSRRLSTISYGEERPTCMSGTEACWAENRRAHFATR